MPRLLIALAALFITAHASAQNYPTRAIRFIVPAPPGGAPDAIARIVGQRLSAQVGQPVVVDNRGGGNGVIGAEAAKTAQPDGYTIVLGYQGPFAINAVMVPKLPYDPLKDFVPITLLATSQNVLVVHPSFPARSVKELIAVAKQKPGEINYASGGTGQSSHLSMELLTHMAGIRMTHIPYKGAGPALADTISGHVPLHFVAVAAAIPLAKAGKLIPLAVTGSERVPSLPDVPTVAEAGLPGYEVLPWYGALAPANTPRDIVQRLYTEMAAALKSPEVRSQYEHHGLTAGGMPPEQFHAFIEGDIAKWRKLVADAGIKGE
jgi:tripartite-type tricarboxylate transporter receptor subunit TctC